MNCLPLCEIHDSHYKSSFDWLSRRFMTTIGKRIKNLRGSTSQAELGKILFGGSAASAQAKIKRIEADTQELTVGV